MEKMARRERSAAGVETAEEGRDWDRERREEKEKKELVEDCSRYVETWRKDLERMVAETRDMELRVVMEVKKKMEKVREKERRRAQEERERMEAGFRKEREEWRRVEGRMRERIRVLEGRQEGREKVEAGLGKEKGERRREEERMTRRSSEQKGGEEERERERRRNNVVIKSMEWRTEKLEQEIEEYVREEAGIEIRMKRARRVRAKGKVYGVVAELGSWEEKWELMTKKRELGRGVYSDEDLTKEEREIQKRLRWMGYEEREKGEGNVKVGYQGLVDREEVVRME